jgi:endonuclease/exonuclease/phosphatase (EEP) superfamily protein YafD
LPTLDLRSRPRAPAALALAAGAGLAAAVVLGFFGDFLPALDTLGQFRAHASAALAVLGLGFLAARQSTPAFGAFAVAALGLYSAMPFVVPTGAGAASAAPGAPRYTLLQMNLRYDAPDRSRALSLIAETKPDVVTAQEVTPEWKADLEKLGSAYPYRFYCAEPFIDGDTAILSRRPFDESADGRPGGRTLCHETMRLAAKTVDFNGLPVTIGAQHLDWPWPWRQPRMLEELAPTLAALRDPVILAGDFNATPWSSTVRRYASASRTRVLAGIGPTWIANLVPPSLARWIGLPIDNVLVSDGIEVLGVRTLAPTASDHLPVLVTFTMRFAMPEEPEVQSVAR